MGTMLNRLRTWLGLAPAPMPSVPPVVEATPLDALLESRAHAGAVVCRNLMLNRREEIAGYEFSLGRKGQSHPAENAALLRAYDDAMLRDLSPLGRSSFMDDRLCFIRVSVASLDLPSLETFAHLNTHIMISPAVLAECDATTLREQLKRLRGIGLRFGWTIDRPLSAFGAQRELLESLLAEARLIEIDAGNLDGIEIKTLHQRLRAGAHSPATIASQLPTADDFAFCQRCGFDFFMGPFVERRDHWHPAKSEINRLRVFEVLDMVRADAPYDAIANALRSEPTLTFKLLRYVNSSAFGFARTIDNIAQMLTVLGRDRFYRWLSLLLFDLSEPGFRARVLTEQALTRARFMELLAGRGKVPAEGEALFLTGLFSLLDVMMGQPLADVLKQIRLPSTVEAALCGEPGALRAALELGIAIESANPQRIVAAAEPCGLTAADITQLTLDTLAGSQRALAKGEALPLGTGLIIEALAGAQHLSPRH